MSDPASYRPAPGSVPDAPGVYKFRDEHGRAIYVGKAKSLRARINSYFQDVAGLLPRTQAMVRSAASVEWTVVSTEVEALQLEYNWIKEFDPRFNVRYRDDKSYPYLAVTLDEEYPRAMVMRGARRKGTRYFGPYAHAWAIRETLDLLLRVFPMRTCSAGVFKRAHQVGRPCLLGYIGKCSAPCVGQVDAVEHRQIAADFVAFVSGQTSTFVRRLEREMQAASDRQDYERAARLRDDISALKRAIEKQAVVLSGGTDADVIALTQDALEAAVQIFYVRGGRVRGQRGWIVDKVEDLSTGELIGEFIGHLYGADRTDHEVPREILVPELPPDAGALTQWLAQMRNSRVGIRVPRRGDKKALLEVVARNAEQAFQMHKLKRASDITARSRALADLQDGLGLDEAPLRIECFDVSNLHGEDVVASLVVFEDGLPRKSEYRRFAIRTTLQEGRADDVASMHEVVRRRFARYLEERRKTGELDVTEDGAPARPAKFAYPPNLVVVDGGAPQVAAAQRALDELGIDDVALCGLAKRLEEVWLPNRSDPVVMARTSEALYLLQRVRDEAHRFAITYHRQRRSKRVTTSALEGIPGLGDVRRKALLRQFGSLRRLAQASAEEIATVPGIGRATAEAVVSALRDTQPQPGVNAATGEILAVVGDS